MAPSAACIGTQRKRVLELRAEGMTGRAIALADGMSRKSVLAVFDARLVSGDAEVYALLFPGRGEHESVFVQPDWDEVHIDRQQNVVFQVFTVRIAVGVAQTAGLIATDRRPIKTRFGRPVRCFPGAQPALPPCSQRRIGSSYPARNARPSPYPRR